MRTPAKAVVGRKACGIHPNARAVTPHGRRRRTKPFILAIRSVVAAPFEQDWEAVEVEFDAVAVVAPDGFLDQQEHVVPDFLVAVIERVALVGVETGKLLVSPPEARLEVSPVMSVVHPEREQYLPFLPPGFGDHHCPRIDALLDEMIEIGDRLASVHRPFLLLFGVAKLPSMVPTLVG